MADRAMACVVSLCVLLQVGCSADGGDVGQPASQELEGYSAVETEAMLSAAEDLGFARGDLALGNGAIVAETDMLLEPETLLAHAGEADALNGPGLSPQGYYTRGSVSAEGVYSVVPPRANSIRLSFDASVPGVWKTAVRNAAAQWNPNECIQISESSGSDKLLVKVDTTLPAGVLAVAMLPFSKNGVLLPGREIRVAANPGVSAAALKYAAMHELGHTLGFHHPGLGKHIPGTSVDTDATDASSYPTVLALSGPVRSSLTSDDIASRDAMFRRFTRMLNGRRVTACPDGVGTLVF